MPGLLLAIRKVVRLKVTSESSPSIDVLLLSNHLPLFSFCYAESGLWPREIPVRTEVFRQLPIKIRVKKFHCHEQLMSSCKSYEGKKH